MVSITLKNLSTTAIREFYGKVAINLDLLVSLVISPGGLGCFTLGYISSPWSWPISQQGQAAWVKVISLGSFLCRFASVKTLQVWLPPSSLQDVDRTPDVKNCWGSTEYWGTLGSGFNAHCFILLVPKSSFALKASSCAVTDRSSPCGRDMAALHPRDALV